MLKVEKEKEPCWIICTPRSGSTYLSHILNNSGDFTSNFSEYLGWKRGQFLSPTNLEVSAPKFCKVLHVHLNRIFYEPNRLENIPFNDIQQFLKPSMDARKYIEKCLPGIRFILLKRRDKIAQAVSYCMTSAISACNHTSYFNILTEESQIEFKNTEILISDDELLSYYNTILKYENVWDDFIVGSDNIFNIYYEDINEEGLKCLFKYLKISEDKIKDALDKTNSSIFKAATVRADSDKYYNKLYGLINSL